MNSGEHIKIHFSEELGGLLDSTRQFVELFELVFDLDWEMTQTWIRNGKHMISEEGTFIHPMVDDESNDWSNRGSLLAHYRDLVERMEALGIERNRWTGGDQDPADE